MNEQNYNTYDGNYNMDNKYDMNYENKYNQDASVNGSDTVPKLGWSWGAFSFGWIWGIGNHAYLTLITLIPIPLLWIIWIFINGALGKKWAWESGKFANAAEFNAVQKSWDRAGIAAFIISIIMILLLILLISLIAIPLIMYESMPTSYSVPII